MPRILLIVLATALVSACDNKAKDSTAVDITRGGTKAMERAKDVSSVLEQGAARARDADQDEPAKKGN
jgi:hypothetical protein